MSRDRTLFQSLPYLFQHLDQSQNHFENFLESFESHIIELDEYGDDAWKITNPYFCPKEYIQSWKNTLDIPTDEYNPELIENGDFSKGVESDIPDDWSATSATEFYLEDGKGVFYNIGSGSFRVASNLTDVDTALQYERVRIKFDYYDMENLLLYVGQFDSSGSLLGYILTGVTLSGSGRIDQVIQPNAAGASRIKIGFVRSSAANSGKIDNVSVKGYFSPEEILARKMIANANYIKRTMRHTQASLQLLCQLLTGWTIDIHQSYATVRYGILGNRICVSIDPDNTDMMDSINTANEYVCRFFDPDAEPNIVYVDVTLPTSPVDPRATEKKALIEYWAPRFVPNTVKCIVIYGGLDTLLYEDGDGILFEDGSEIQIEE